MKGECKHFAVLVERQNLLKITTALNKAREFCNANCAIKETPSLRNDFRLFCLSLSIPNVRFVAFIPTNCSAVHSSHLQLTNVFIPSIETFTENRDFVREAESQVEDEDNLISAAFQEKRVRQLMLIARSCVGLFAQSVFDASLVMATTTWIIHERNLFMRLSH